MISGPESIHNKEADMAGKSWWVEILKVGKWVDARGTEVEFTTEDLYDRIFSTFCIGK